MNMYWSMAITSDGTRLFTYNAVLTVDKAFDQFVLWEKDYGYSIVDAYIDVQYGDNNIRLNCDRNSDGKWCFTKVDVKLVEK